MALAEGQSVQVIDDRGTLDIKGGESFVGAQIEGIGDQAGRVAGSRLVHGIAVVEDFRVGVNAAQGETAAEATAQIEVQRVIGTVATGEPRPGVRESGIGFGGSSRNVVGAGGEWGSGQRRAYRGTDGGADFGARWLPRVVWGGAIAEGVLQMVVHAEAGAEDGSCAEWTPGYADARLWEKFCVVLREQRGSDVWLAGDHAVAEGVVGGAAVRLVPAVGSFLAKSEGER